MKHPLLSVIIPVYNTKPYLERCLNSVLNQTFKDLEVICVDDGSTDGSGELLDEFKLTDSRIKVVHKENGGLVSARKTGLSQANGKYTAYVDSDDWIEPEMYQNLTEKMILSSAQIAVSGFIRDYGNHTIVDNEKVTEGVYTGQKLQNEIQDCLVDYEEPFCFLLSPSLCNKVFETSILREYQMSVPNCVTIDEDTVVTIPLIKHIKALCASSQSFYHYCSRNDSMLNDKTSDESYAIQKAYEYMRSRVDRKTSDYFEIYARLQMCPETVLQCVNGTLPAYRNVSTKDKIVLYGAGSYGKGLKRYLQSKGFLIVAWVDKSGDGEKILRPEHIVDVEHDVIIIAVLLQSVVSKIKEDLFDLGVQEKEIVKFTCNFTTV